MKKITNFRNASVCDLEGDSLTPTLIHVVSYELAKGKSGSLKGKSKDKLRKFFQHHIDNEMPVVFHNGATFDIPVLERILEMDLSKIMLIDTLWVSWYLNCKRKVHGLDSFFEDYGIEKPKIEEDDWAFTSDDPDEIKAHYERMKYRCEQDVAINSALWKDLIERLTTMYGYVKTCVDNGYVDGTRVSEGEVRYIDQYKDNSTVDEYIDRLLTFIMFKADCARLQEKCRWKVDVPKLHELDGQLLELVQEATKELESVMPPVPKYVKKNEPKEFYKKNGELNAHAIKWNEFVDSIDKKDDNGNKIAYCDDEGQCWRLTKYEPPNINSSHQIKKWLFTNGWKPQNFEFKTDEKAKEAWVESGFRKDMKPKPRAIPQINIEGDEGKELCPSVVKLADKIPEIMAYSKYTLIKHRYDMIQGFKTNMSEDGYLKARIGGTTNTMRVKHRELVNLPSAKKPWGKEIRGLLVCKEGSIQLGTDLSGLEDRVKHDFMIPHDPEYVETMMGDDYDPHLDMCLEAEMVAQGEVDAYKQGTLSEEDHDRISVVRAKGKSTNYASQYNSGADTLARTADIPVKQAKELLKAYWSLNWSIKVIAEEQEVFKDDEGNSWLINPVNGFCYSLRKDSDRFSTLCQGTGSFYFDMWVSNVLDAMQERWGVKVLNGSFHDEFITNFKDKPKFREAMTEIVNNAIEDVNKTYMLRRPLGCDIQFGLTYADIH